MVINISINTTFSIHDSVKNYLCSMILTKININTFDVLTFIQMSTDWNNFWQIRNTVGNGCYQVRRDFDKWLCKKICGLSWTECANKFSIATYLFLQIKQNNY